MSKLRKILIIFISIILFLTTPQIIVHADYNGGGNAAAGGQEKDAGGASTTRTGIRAYVVDENGNVVSKVVDYVAKQPSVDQYLTSTRIGNKQVSEIKPYIEGMPLPLRYESTFVGNGEQFRNYMLGTNSEGVQNIKAFIQDTFGMEVLQLFTDKSKEYFLAIEVVYWHSVYTGTDASDNSGISVYGSVYEWLKFYANNGLMDGGFTKNVDNKVALQGFALSKDEPKLGLTKYTGTGYMNLYSLGTMGGGIHLFSNLNLSLMSGTHTWDYDSGSTPDKAPDNSTGTTTIIKNYRTKISDTKYIDDGCFKRTNTDNTILIEDEPEYTVIGWKVTDKTKEPSSLNWNPQGTVYDSGTKHGSTEVKEPATTLYVLLEKSDNTDIDFDGDYKVSESQITRKIGLSVTDKGESILLGHNFIWTYGALNSSCGGHRVEDPCNHTLPVGVTECNKEHYHYEYCNNWELEDSTLKLKIKNNLWNTYPNNIAATSYFSQLLRSEVNYNRDSTAAGSISEQFQYNVVLHRGNDKLTVAEWKNTNSAINSLANFNTASLKTLPTRKIANYKENISFEFTDNSVDLITLLRGDKGCTVSDTASYVESSSLNKSVDILYETYSGKTFLPLNTDINSNDMMTVGSSGNTVSSGRMVSSGLNFSFHPYIKMRYDTIYESNKEVFILGEYERSMQPNDYAEITWEKPKSGEYNMKLDSTQWSLHSQANKDLEDVNGRLLPGGATLTLSIGKNDRQKVKVTTYQCILIDKGREQVEKTTGTTIDGYTKETAIQYHQDYVASVMKGLDGMSVAQYQNIDYEADPFKGINVYSESDIRDLKNGNSISSKESKYYFKSGTSENNMDEGDLDVIEGGTSTVYYTFSTDTSGNVLMNGVIILNKGQGVESITNSVARSIESKTLVVTKLIAAVERNSGNDTGAPWAPDGHWYNEAFDGITVAISTTTIETGFISPAGQRMTIQDPKLNTKSYGQKYMFRDKEGNLSYNVSAFKMNNYSDEYKKENVIGMFKGQEVKMKDMDMLYISQPYYISNITVQDLY